MSDLQALFDMNIEAYLQGPALLAALVGFGLLVGILTGLFGVGGAFLLTPLLNVGFGIPYPLAIGSGLSFTIGTSSSGMRRHIRLANFESRSMLILAGASMAGAVLGGMLNKALDVSLGRYNYTLMMHLLFVVTLALTAWVVARNKPEHPSGKSPLQRLRLPPHIDLPTVGLKAVSVPGLCAVGVFIGIMKGMMGIGGGVLFMPLLILVVGLTPHQAVGTSLGVVVFSSIAGTIKYGLDGNVNLCLVMSLLVSSVLGVQLGAWICHRLHAGRLRRYFAVLVLLVAVAVAARMVYQLHHGPAPSGQ
ncbi:MAG: sulfite exporter TauE/SafE family protein [Planctomycetota bacterium]|nr:sulfite exporter TauE/SafE family protein [Planctomycetota bacterium]